MIRRCAWCGCDLESPPAVTFEAVSHGICLACVQEMLALQREPDTGDVDSKTSMPIPSPCLQAG